MPAPEEMSRDELIVVVARQAERLAAQDRQIAEMAGQLAELMEANEALADKLARLEHLLSRNSGNSSSPPSRDDDPGKPAPPEKQAWPGRAGAVAGQAARGAGVASGVDRRPARAPRPVPAGPLRLRRTIWPTRADLGVVDRYQQHEIPQVAVRITQYDQHQVACGCGRRHTAARPDGARPGPVGYGPNLAAFAVYLMVVHFVPAHRVRRAAGVADRDRPSVGFVHGMLARTAGLLGEVHDRIRTLITLAYAVCCDETPLRVGAAHPRGRARRRPSGTCWWPAPSSTPTTCSATAPWTRSRPSCSPSAPQRGSVVVHDRYQNYDSAELAGLVHQLCCAAPAARSRRRRPGLPRRGLAGPDRRRAARADPPGQPRPRRRPRPRSPPTSATR